MNFFSGVRRTALQSQSCPKNNMGASLGFFGRVRPTFPWARGWSAGVGPGPPCLHRVGRQPGRRSKDPRLSLPGCEPGRLGVGPSSQTRPTRTGTVEPGRLGMPVVRGPDGQTRPTTSVTAASATPGDSPRRRPEKGQSSTADSETVVVPVGRQSMNRRVDRRVEPWVGALPTRS